MKNENIKFIWIRAEGNPDRSVTYYDKEGNHLTRYLDPSAKDPPRGTKSWRHQNPGNIVHGPFSKSHGEIGFACYPAPDHPKKKRCFAIFPDYETGRKALAILLKTNNYIDLTLNEFPKIYTGLKKNDPDTKEVKEYRDALRKISQFDMNRTIRSFEGNEYEKLIDTLQRCEGWYSGDEKFESAPEKVIGVKFINRKSAEFLIQSSDGTKNWISRAQAIVFAKAKKLLAVIVHSQHGIYLRPFPHQTRFHNMMIQ
jgi:hypothetical protein